MRAEPRRTLLIALGLAGLLYTIPVAVLLVREQELVYAARWSRSGIDTTLAAGWRRVQIHGTDGQLLDAVVATPRGPPRGSVLYLHGNAASIWSGQVRDKLSTYQRMGYQVLAIDYRGYGVNAGTPSEGGLIADGLAGARYAEDSLRVPPGELVIHGMSLGSGVAAAVAVARPPRLLILDGAFTSLPDVGAEVYPWIPVRWLMRNRFPTLARLDSLRTPLLLVHATNDEVIPFSNGQRLAAAGYTPLRVLNPAGGHVAGAFGDLPAFRQVLDSMLSATDH